MPLLFAAALFVSAALLFWVQPLVAKMLLPLLGGTPAVWNTCLLFFQAVLLAGYAYALALTRWLSTRAQVLLHVSLLLAAAVTLPVGLPASAAEGVPAGGEPVWWLLATLFVSVGLPFFALSATAPLLQRWFSKTRDPRARDPYFLYAASNAGSLIALVGFPLVAEPNLRLAGQGRAWAAGYAALVLLIMTCALALLRSRPMEVDTEPRDRGDASDETEADAGAETLTKLRRLRWAFLAFVPSSLVLGVTTYVTTDVAAVPLLWVLPLALYLLTFVIAFSRGRLLDGRLADRLLPGAAIILTVVYLSGATEPAWFLVLVHLVFLYIAALACHRRLADDRPAPRHLAEFFLWVAAGGAAGGLFNALLAPLLFDTVVEYPLAVVLACLARVPFGAPRQTTTAARDRDGIASLGDSNELRVEDSAGLRGEGGDESRAGDEARRREERRARVLDVLLPAAFGVAVAVLTGVVTMLEMGSIERLAISLGLPLIFINHVFQRRPVRFALALGAVMLSTFLLTDGAANTLHAERNFYGVVRVMQDASNDTLRLHHGSTIHGRQFADPARACEPLSYYHPSGPLGSLFETYGERAAASQTSPHVAAVGLGTGAVVAYSRPGQTWTFYEINPEVVRLARDTSAFTYLRDCARAPASVVLGDARLQMRAAPASHYGLVLLDAFSSDAVPAHLLTREAIDLYLSKLAGGGLIAFHVSNRGLDLHAVVGGLARDAGLSALVFDDPSFDNQSGKEPSEWVVVARRPEDLSALATDPNWQPLNESPRRRFEVWRDDFSDIITVFKWRG